MKTSAILYKAPNTFIFDLPAGPLRQEEGLWVQQPPETIIVAKHTPSLLQVLETNWVDPVGYEQRCGLSLEPVFGGYVPKFDIEERTSVHLVRKSERFDTPEVGYCFYGMVFYSDRVTQRIIGPFGGEEEPMILEFGDVQRREIVWYLSQPIYDITKIEDPQSLTKLYRNEELSLSEKGKELFRYLRGV